VDDYDEWLKAWQTQPSPQPIEPLWSFQKDGHTISCVLTHHARYGVEAQFLCDGDLRIGRRFDTKELAVQLITSGHRRATPASQSAPHEA
jgi:hypothetical protein